MAYAIYIYGKYKAIVYIDDADIVNKQSSSTWSSTIICDWTIH